MIVLALTARPGPRDWRPPDLALLAWLVWSVAAMVGATSGWHAVRAVSISLSGAMVYWAAASLRDAGLSRAVGVVLVTAVTLAAGSSLAQAYGVDSDLFSTNRAPGGFLGNRNFVAHVAAMAVPLLVWLTATSRGALGVALGVAGLVTNVSVLVLSRTRAAWLAIAVWAVAMVMVVLASREVARAAFLPKRGRLVIGSVVVATIAALVIPNTLDWKSDSPYLDSVRGVVNYRDGSGAGRLRQYANSLKLTRAHPMLGVGPGNWPAEYPAVAGRNDPSLSDATGMASNPWPSSDWVAAISERGIPAALALVAFFAILLRNAWRGLRDSVFSSRDRLAAVAGGGVVLIAGFEGMFDAVSLLAFPTVIVCAAAGALIPGGGAVVVVEPPVRRRTYLLATGVVAWLGMVAMSAGKLEAMRLYSKGTLTAVQQAADYDPQSYRVQLRAAELLAGRGYCRLAYHNALAASALFPHAGAPKAILARCVGSTK
jgi:O-antigen ligase